MRNIYTVEDITCDRCHKEISIDFTKYAKLVLNDDSEKEMDLCEQCYNVLEDFRWGRNREEKK